MTYLEARGEVRLSFIANRTTRDRITRIVSIDRVQRDSVIAYANKEEFLRFTSLGIPFRVLPPIGTNRSLSPLSKKFKSTINSIEAFPALATYLSELRQFSVDYPELCTFSEIGRSVKGRPLVALKISDNVTEQENEPEFICTGTLHGDEPNSMFLCAYLIEDLLSQYGKDSLITELVDNLQLWILPLVNPDGAFIDNDTLKAPIRENANYRDLNRDFPNPGDALTLEGRQPETRILMEFEMRHHFSMGIDFHNGAYMVVIPYAYTTRYPPDKEWWLRVANTYVAQARQDWNDTNAYHEIDVPTGVASAAADYFLANGTRIDFPYHFLHCRSLTIEFNSNKYFMPELWPKSWQGNRRAILGLFQEALLGIRGTVTDQQTGQPIDDVKVFVDGLDIEADSSFTRSNESGFFTRPINPGVYQITFSKPGYGSSTIADITVSAGQATVLSVSLAPASPVVKYRKQMQLAHAPFIHFTPFGPVVKTYGRHLQGTMHDATGRTLGSFTAASGNTVVWRNGSILAPSTSKGFRIFTLEDDLNRYTVPTVNVR